MKIELTEQPLSCHSMLVAIGIEDEAHTTGVKCVKALWDGQTLTLDDATVFETGQPPGQLSAAKLALLDAEIVKRYPNRRRAT